MTDDYPMRPLILLLAFTLCVSTALVSFAVLVSRTQPRESLLVYRTDNELIMHTLSHNRDWWVAAVPYVNNFASVNGEQIAFPAFTEARDIEIFLWDIENSPRNISNGTLAVSSPALAVDGRVAFVSQTEPEFKLLLWNPADNTLSPIGEFNWNLIPPVWSRQGRLAYFNKRTELNIYEPDGTTILVRSKDSAPSTAAWSADGRLAFLAYRGAALEVMIMEADGKLTTLGSAIVVSDLIWSLDGRLAFAAYDIDNIDIFVWMHDEFVNISNHAASDDSPVWSADGRLAFISERDGNAEIYVWDGDSLQNISNHRGVDVNPAWSASGQLAFASNRDGNREIYIWSADTGLQNVTNTPASNEFAPLWLDPPRP